MVTAMSHPGTRGVPKVKVRRGFPGDGDTPCMVEAPTYHPSPEQFEDPISYIASIQTDAEPYGMCRIVPPEGWKVNFFHYVQ